MLWKTLALRNWGARDHGKRVFEEATCCGRPWLCITRARVLTGSESLKRQRALESAGFAKQGRVCSQDACF